MTIKQKRTVHIEENLDFSYSGFNTNDKVIVYKDVLAYDLFDLVVDLGSALGLWLGLSALSIFDYTAMFISKVKYKYYH